MQWPHVTRIVPLANVTLDVWPNDDQSASDQSGNRALGGGVITIGNFDGVHLGHAMLLNEVRRTADRLGGRLSLSSWTRILRPFCVRNCAPSRLTWIERRAELMAVHGIDAMVVCPTTQAFLRMTAESFFDSLVVERLQARAMVEGPNFFFGRDRGGDIATLGRLCAAGGIELRIIEPSEQQGEMVSSTRICQRLEQGHVEQANRLLGTPYRIRGTVVGGVRRGRVIGFPTANLDGIDVLIPGPGVYGGTVTVGDQQHVAAIDIGPNPTFDCDGSLKVEIHLLDYDGDLYGQTLLVDVVIRVRDIARFDSAQSLVDS